MRLARCVLQFRSQVNREAERKAHSGITASGFHIEMISQRYHLCGNVLRIIALRFLHAVQLPRGPWTTAYRSPASVTRSVPRRTCSGTTMKPSRELRIRS
jgi:hypothetical protein